MVKLLFIFPLFIANLVVAFPFIPQRISAQLKTAFVSMRHEKINNIPGTCKDIEICQLVYDIFRFCKKIRKCTL